MKELSFFYKSLYRNNEQYSENQTYDFIKLVSLPTIDETQKTQCETPVTKHECLTAISQLTSNRSPGPDGLAIEFYKVFWDDIKYIFMKCLHYSISTNLRKPISAKHKNKLKPDRQIFFFLRSTNLFGYAQNFFTINKTFSQSTKLFRNRQIFFAMHKSFSRSTKLFRSRQIFLAMHKYFSRSTKL